MTQADRAGASQTGRAETPQAARPSCKQCGGTQLTALSGKYGYYWKCACGANTAMPTLCGKCGAEGWHGETVRIRKEGKEYFRECAACGGGERVWRE